MSCLERGLIAVGGRKLVWAERGQSRYYSQLQVLSAETLTFLWLGAKFKSSQSHPVRTCRRPTSFMASPLHLKSLDTRDCISPFTGLRDLLRASHRTQDNIY